MFTFSPRQDTLHLANCPAVCVGIFALTCQPFPFISKFWKNTNQLDKKVQNRQIYIALTSFYDQAGEEHKRYIVTLCNKRIIHKVIVVVH